MYNIYRQDGKTALICSAKNGHVEIMRLLLHSKADLLDVSIVTTEQGVCVCARARAFKFVSD